MHSTDHSELAPILFIPHGGGPLPLLGDPGHRELAQFLSTITTELETPEAIIVISAHWEESVPTLTSANNPGLIYDYYGFPPESYDISYPARGEPALASRIEQLLRQHGEHGVLDSTRGFDHGLFVPLKLMYPNADIPCLQLSLIDSLDPGAHISLGEALRKIRREKLLILGSGFSFHNLPALMNAKAGQSDTRNQAFEHWLTDTCTNRALSEETRRDRLINWQQAPYANYCHPRSEHLLPLHICYGLAGSPARQVFDGQVMGMQASAFLW